MRWFRFSVAALAAASAIVVVSHGALAQATALQVTVGETRTLELDGNPSTGYSWVLHDASGVDGQVASVDVKGYAPRVLKPGERPQLGAGQKFQVLVTGVAPGRVTVTFDYVKGGIPAPASSRSFAIEVLDDASKPPSDQGQDDAGEDPTSEKPADSKDDLFADPQGTEDGGGDDDPD